MSDEFYTFYATGLKSLGDNLVEGYISTGDKDLVNDIVTPECMMDMLVQLQSRSIKLDLEHEAFRGKSAVEREINKSLIPAAKITDAMLDAKGIKVITKLNKNYPKYEMLKGNLDEGFLDAFSIAYVPEKVRTKGNDRYLDKVNLLNVAFTGNPVNPKASFTSVLMKSLQDEVCKIKGGISMKTEEKEVVSDSKLEVKALVEKYDALEKQVSELKSLLEKKDVEAVEPVEAVKAEEPKKEDSDESDDAEAKKKKAKKEEVEAEAKSKEAEAKSLDLEAKLKSIEAKQAEIDKVLSAPIFKARAEIMQKALNEEAIIKQDKEIKSRGTLDLIR
jgi:polyisoprenoid-binding protein YceI